MKPDNRKSPIHYIISRLHETRDDKKKCKAPLHDPENDYVF